MRIALLLIGATGASLCWVALTIPQARPRSLHPPIGLGSRWVANQRLALRQADLAWIPAWTWVLGRVIGPAVAGVLTAIVGSILCSLMSNSELTIKGPAAGLIVIALGAVTEFGFTGGKDPAADFQAYRLALGVGVAAGVLQIVFSLLRAGTLSEFTLRLEGARPSVLRLGTR